MNKSRYNTANSGCCPSGDGSGSKAADLDKCGDGR